MRWTRGLSYIIAGAFSLLIIYSLNKPHLVSSNETRQMKLNDLFNNLTQIGLPDQTFLIQDDSAIYAIGFQQIPRVRLLVDYIDPVRPEFAFARMLGHVGEFETSWQTLHETKTGLIWVLPTTAPATSTDNEVYHPDAAELMELIQRLSDWFANGVFKSSNFKVECRGDRFDIMFPICNPVQ